MSWSADIADAIIALDTAIADFENAQRRLGNENVLKHETWTFLKEAIEIMQGAAIGDEGQHFDSVDEARDLRKPRCWGTTSTFRNYATGQDEFHKPTCGRTEEHGPHII